MFHYDHIQKQAFWEGPAGRLAVPADDDVSLKLAMLVEGECSSQGPAATAHRFGYSKQRYYQLLQAYQTQGATGLSNHKRGPKTHSRRTDEAVRQIIRHRFLDPDASCAVIAQKLRQTGLPLSTRSVERVITDYGLQKKTVCRTT
jgi:transposase